MGVKQLLSEAQRNELMDLSRLTEWDLVTFHTSFVTNTKCVHFKLCSSIGPFCGICRDFLEKFRNSYYTDVIQRIRKMQESISILISNVKLN